MFENPRNKQWCANGWGNAGKRSTDLETIYKRGVFKNTPHMQRGAQGRAWTYFQVCCGASFRVISVMLAAVGVVGMDSLLKSRRRCGPEEKQGGTDQKEVGGEYMYIN